MPLLLLLLQVDLGLCRDCIESGDSRKSKKRVDNKRHNNAHPSLTSRSPIGATIPLSDIHLIGNTIISTKARFCLVFVKSDTA